MVGRGKYNVVIHQELLLTLKGYSRSGFTERSFMQRRSRKFWLATLAAVNATTGAAENLRELGRCIIIISFVFRLWL